MKNYKIKLIINGKEKIININENDIHIGINSGLPFKKQWIFLDIDDMKEEEVVKLAREMLYEENLRRILVVKSSNTHNGWHIISFSPKSYSEMIEILSRYHDSGEHIAKTQDNGFATLRITPKNGFKPKIMYVIDNNKKNKNLNFYDYDAEKAYRKLLEVT